MITIRKATSGDIDRLAALFDLYRIFYQQPPDMAGAIKFLNDRLANNESMIFIAEQEDAFVGFTQLYPIFSSVSMQRAWLLNDLYVLASARKKGVAAMLLEGARQFGIQTNAKYLLLETQKDNFAAQSVYEKNGWARTSDYFYELSLPVNN